MKKKLTLKQIVDARRALTSTFTDKVNFKLAYAIAQFVDATQVDADFWDKNIKDISADCVNEDGMLDVQKLDKLHADELEELATQEKEVDCKITLKDLEGNDISPFALMTIMPILTDEE